MSSHDRRIEYCDTSREVEGLLQIVLGDQPCIEGFGPRFAATSSHRRIAAVGTAMVADIKIRAHLRRRQQERLADAGELRRPTGTSTTANPTQKGRYDNPRRKIHVSHEIHANNTGTSAAAFSRLSVMAPNSSPANTGVAAAAAEQHRCTTVCRHQQQIERRFLQDAIEKNRGRIKCEQNSWRTSPHVH